MSSHTGGLRLEQLEDGCILCSIQRQVREIPTPVSYDLTDPLPYKSEESEELHSSTSLPAQEVTKPIIDGMRKPLSVPPVATIQSEWSAWLATVQRTCAQSFASAQEAHGNVVSALCKIVQDHKAAV